jgi:hypothetical protein
VPELVPVDDAVGVVVLVKEAVAELDFVADEEDVDVAVEDEDGVEEPVDVNDAVALTDAVVLNDVVMESVEDVFSEMLIV